MNENKKLRLWQWALFLLMLCNIALLLVIWLRPSGGRDFEQPRGETPRDFVVRNLKFTAEQTNQYDVLVKDHQAAMRRLRHEAMEYRQQLFANLANENKPGINPDSLAQLIAANQEQVEMVTYKHFGQVRALCTDAQKPEFDKIIGDVIKKMNGGPHPPGDRQGPQPGEHGPPGGPPPPPHDLQNP